MRKRRIGLGMTGVADALIKLGIRYGSPEAQDLVRGWTKAIQVASYGASVNLARERRPFPLFDADAFLASPNVRGLPVSLQKSIRQHGIRNGVLNTVAPNGCRPLSAITTTDKGILTLGEMISDPQKDGWAAPSEDVSVIQENEKHAGIRQTFCNGVKPVYRIKMNYGLVVESTIQHPWWVIERLGGASGYARSPVGGWVATGDLRINDVLDVRLGAYTFDRHTRLDPVSIDSLHGNAVPVQQPTHMSESLAWLLGYLWGNGALSPTKWRIRFSSGHKEHLEKCRSIIRDEFGIEGGMYPQAGQESWNLEVPSRHLWMWLHANGFSKYSDCGLADIPRAVRSSSRDDIAAFVAGFIDADGAVYAIKDYVRRVEFKTSDERFAHHMQDVCWAIGLGFSRGPSGKGGYQTSGRMWVCTLSAHATEEAFSALARNSEKIKNFCKDLPFTHQRDAKNKGIIGKIVGIDLIGDMPTYDIEVDGEPWFFAGSVKSHNTIAIYSGNVSSGVEPVYAFDKVTRKVRQPDGTLAPYESVNYSYRLYEAIHGHTEREGLPDYFVGAMDITPEEHVLMQAACQEYIDASISKTINVPTETSFDEFKGV